MLSASSSGERGNEAVAVAAEAEQCLQLVLASLDQVRVGQVHLGSAAGSAQQCRRPGQALCPLPRPTRGAGSLADAVCQGPERRLAESL